MSSNSAYNKKNPITPYMDSYPIDYQDGDVSVERRGVDGLPAHTQRSIHTVKDGETIQSIAYQYYGDSGYWGIIADVNRIYDPFEDVVADMELIIPFYGGYQGS